MGEWKSVHVATIFRIMLQCDTGHLAYRATACILMSSLPRSVAPMPSGFFSYLRLAGSFNLIGLSLVCDTYVSTYVCAKRFQS